MTHIPVTTGKFVGSDSVDEHIEHGCDLTIVDISWR